MLPAAMLHHAGAWEKALAEAIRVLRPGGRLPGDDLLDTAPVRLLHFGGGHGTRLLGLASWTASWTGSGPPPCARKPA